MKDPRQIADRLVKRTYGKGTRWHKPNRYDERGLTLALAEGEIGVEDITDLIVKGINAYREQAGIEVGLWRAAHDGVPVVQIDTADGGRLRINLNDAPVWDGDPETDEIPGAHLGGESELDTSSSGSRQHYIDTGRYLTHAEVAEHQALQSTPDTPITITATETIEYSKTYELAELEEYLGATLVEDCKGNLQEFVDGIHEKAHGYNVNSPGFAEDLESNGDVQGQTWKGTIEGA